MDFTFAGGCIRFTDTGPEWHINTRHTTVGFDTTVPPQITSEGDLYATMTETLDVVAAIASPDETLAEKGVWAGVSGGVGHCKIRLRKYGLPTPLDLNDPDHYASVRGEWSNLWLFVLRVAGTQEG